jgi:hypothetical protein
MMKDMSKRQLWRDAALRLHNEENNPQESGLQLAKKSKSAKHRYLQLKVSLKDIEPTIWRTFVVSTSMTFEDLHEALQEIMGWESYHLYEFKIGSRGNTMSITSPECMDDWGSMGCGDSSDFDLTFLTKKGMKFTYVYDFGDSWEHTIIVQDANYDYSGALPFFVLAGERNCPPEDCGGVYGYYDIIEALKDPEGDSEILEWAGDYDPERFSIETYTPPNTKTKTAAKKTKKNTKKKKK